MACERRKSSRVDWNASGLIYDCDGDWGFPCLIADLSNGGAKISGVVADDLPDEFMLRISRARGTRKCRVLWRAEGRLGIAFTNRFASADGPSSDRARGAPGRTTYG
jgi:hypothetical protein